jgi:TPR repeat protein
VRNLTYYKIAIQNYYLIAQQDNAYAQYKTGIQYLRGEGIKKDRCESTYWFDKSARAGNGTAQFQLARSYYYGYGIEQDIELAYLWARTAIENVQNTTNEIDRLKSFYMDVQNELKNDSKLDSADKKYRFWQYKNQQPVKITKLRKIPVFDQFLSEMFNTQPCN